jgi:septum formation protein
MITTSKQIYLASKSPRRKKLLKQIGLKFKTISIDPDEEILDGEHPVQTVKRLAIHKSDAALNKCKNGIIITADTIVVLNNEIIGKPKNEKDAVSILKKLSGNTHKVYTGFCLRDSTNGKMIVDYQVSRVTFRKLNSREITDYVKTGSPMDKAGAYGIQDDFGAVFVNKIEGCYYNVVGLPISKLYSCLMEII